MEEAYHQILEELLEEHGLVCGLIASSAGIEYARVGNFDSLENSGPVNTLVSDAEAISRLDASVDGEIMPQLWSQGRVYAYVTKPDKELLVVLFSQNDKDVRAHNDVAQEVNASLTSKLVNKREK